MKRRLWRAIGLLLIADKAFWTRRSPLKIAPIDIAHKTFSRKVMGLDPDEVADFMRDIAEQMEELIRERNSLKENARQKDLQLMEFKEREYSSKTKDGE